MAVRVTHAKVSGKSAGTDPNRVYGTHWDADHTIEDLTIDGSLEVDGAYDVIVRATGNTDVTLPTTGTLATTAGVAAGYQPLDSDLTAIAAISPSNDDVVQRKAGAWTNRTMAQVTADLAAASESAQGAVELATTAEAQTGTDTSRAITAAGLRASTREKLTATRTYYVRTDGSDSNTGLADTSGGAFLTIQKAIDTVAALDIQTYAVTIQVADGTYTGTMAVVGPWVGSGTVTIQGNSSTPANVLISVGASTTACAVSAGGRLTIKDMKLQATGGGLFLLQATTKGNINFSNLDIGICTSQQIRAQDNGAISCDGNYTISAGAANHWAATAGGVIRVQSKTITVSNSPRFSGAFASGSIGGVMIVNGNTFSYPTITITSANPGVFTHTAHNKSANDPISYATTGALPTNIVAGTTYYVKTVTDANTYTVSATAGGAEIDCSAGVQSGTHTARATGSRYAATDNGTIYTAAGGTTIFPGNAVGTGTNAGTSPYGLYN